MAESAGARFDERFLRDRGGSAYSRGLDYFRKGRVHLLAGSGRRVSAEVQGTETYRVELTGRGSDVDADCTCTAFEDSGFCKHVVAVALAVNAGGRAGVADPDESVLRAHLQAKGVDALVALVLDLAADDPVAMRRLKAEAALARGDDAAVEQSLRRAIDEATATDRLIDYRSMRGWAREARAALDQVGNVLAAGRAGVAFKAAAHALDRLAEAQRAIDDSDGRCVGLRLRARDLHHEAARIVRPEPAALARDLFERELTDWSDAFDGAAHHYADVLGPAGLAAYRRLAEEAFAPAPAADARRTRSIDDEAQARRRRAKEILDGFAATEGDLDGRVALRAKDLSSPDDYLDLARLCLEHGRPDEALRWAEDGLWTFADAERLDGLVRLTADLLVRAGRPSDAYGHLLGLFSKTMNPQTYAAMREVDPAAAPADARRILETRIASGKPAGWTRPSDVLIAILVREGDLEAAWAAYREHGAFGMVERGVVEACAALHSREALETYGRWVDEAIAMGAYEEAVGHLARMAPLRGADEHAAHLADLRLRHPRKRNLLRLLA